MTTEADPPRLPQDSAAESETARGPLVTAERVEFAAKGVGVGIGLIYVVGFAVISLHNGRFGVVNFSILQARALAAGLLFGALVSIPVLLGKAFAESQRGASPSVSRMFDVIVESLIVSALAVLLVAQVLMGEEMDRLRWSNVAGVLLLLSVTIFQFFGRVIGARWKGLFIALAWFCAVGGIVLALRGAPAGFISLLFWTCVVTLLVASGGAVVPPSRDPLNRIQFATMTLSAVVAFFATQVYGRIDARWGGGGPVAVTITVNSPNGPWHNATLRGRLLDEQEHGYYLLVGDEPRALFIPRERVEAVHFERPHRAAAEAAKGGGGN